MFRTPKAILWWSLIAFVIIFLMAPVTGHSLLFQLIHNIEIGFTGHTGIKGPNVHVGK